MQSQFRTSKTNQVFRRFTAYNHNHDPNAKRLNQLDDSYSENAMVCITSAGDVSIISLPSLKFQVKIPAIQLATSDW